MDPKLEKWFFRVAALAWIAMITWFSNQPGSRVHIEPPLDKVIHCCVFGVLGFLIAMGAGSRPGKHAAWIAALVVSILGGLDEFHQSFSPGRSVSLGDWLSDTTGGIAAGIAWLWAWSQGRRSTRPEG